MAPAPGSVERWRPLVAKYFPPDQVDNALAVMDKESGGDPGKHNWNPATGDDSWGLYQINRYGMPTRPLPDLLTTPEFNIQYAAGMYRTQGWISPWHTTSAKLGWIR